MLGVSLNSFPPCFSDKALPEPGAYWFSQTSWPVSSQDLSFYAFPVPGLQMCAAVPSFLCCARARDKNLYPLTHLAGRPIMAFSYIRVSHWPSCPFLLFSSLSPTAPPLLLYHISSTAFSLSLQSPPSPLRLSFQFHDLFPHPSTHIYEILNRGSTQEREIRVSSQKRLESKIRSLQN